MLTHRLGLPTAVGALFAHVDERWDGRGPGGAKRDEILLPVRIVQLARDAAFQRMPSGTEFAARVVRERAGRAFDPAIATRVADEASEILALDDAASAWNETLACEPTPRLSLEGEEIDRALAAMGGFADLASPYLVGHSGGSGCDGDDGGPALRFEATDLAMIRRGALLHDLGRVAVPVRIWQKAGPLTSDDWEWVRLHAYPSERVLTRSPFLAALAPVATTHHERLDGSGYHRGGSRRRAAAAGPPARRGRCLSRDDRTAAAPPGALAGTGTRALGQEARTGRLDADAVTAVLEASGQRAPRIERPAGLTERETEVVGLLARGLQTKQVARALRPRCSRWSTGSLSGENSRCPTPEAAPSLLPRWRHPPGEQP
jgi:hypothetical protein